MKKLFSMLLCLTLILALAPCALAEQQDLVYDRDSTLSASFIKYGSITVKNGATLTVTAGSGFEITGSVYVEPGSAFVCDGVGAGDFNFSMRSKDADITGIDLYYIDQDEGAVKKVPGGYPAIAALDLWSFDGGWCPAFKWNDSVRGWCLTIPLNHNPFGGIVYHNERDMETALLCADRLYLLHLLKGAGTAADGSPLYELERCGTRVEALVMLIRFLGREDAALKGQYSHPFTDVPAWADAYVAYAYETGLTTGVSADKFGTGDATAQMYFTFLLRALGYTDESVETSVWNEAFALAEQTGLVLTQSDAYAVCMDRFWRADMVVTSWRALECETAAGGSLRSKLVSERVFTDGEYNSALGLAPRR